MSEPLIVLAEDDLSTQKVVCDFLQDLNCEVLAFASGKQVWDHLCAHPAPDCLLLDIRLPDLSGLEIFQRVHDLHPSLPVILITGFGNTDQAVQAIKQGAYYYFTKPIDFLLLQRTVGELLEKIRLRRQLARLQDGRDEFGLVGQHPSILQVRQRIRQVADLPTTVIITGETGTGKELVARALHAGGTRRSKPLVAINCAALPESLLESELFGFDKGAFTGATQGKPGKVELAHGGSLLLDEVGEMPLALQAKLLRVIETKTVERLGSVRGLQVDVRFLAATNRDLAELVTRGQFRQDLYFRLNPFEICLPPLRSRLDDIPLLIQHFLDELNRSYNRQIESVDPSVLEAFRRYDWPGNVRELKHILEGAAILCDTKRLKLAHLAPRPAWSDNVSRRSSRLASVEESALVEALQRSKGNQSAAARELGISRNQMRYKMKKYGLGK